MSKNEKDTNNETTNETTETQTVSLAEAMALIDKLQKEVEAMKTATAVTKAKAQVVAADPFKDLVDFEVPMSRYEQDDVSICVNGRRYLIKRGYKVRVPRCVAQTFHESQAQDFATYNKIRELEANTPK